MKNLLVITDMINGFVKNGFMADSGIKKIIPNIELLINGALNDNMEILFFATEYSAKDFSDDETRYCIKDSVECEIIDELKQYEKNFIVIKKNDVDGFYSGNFIDMIMGGEYKYVFVTGCCTDTSIKSFTESFLKFKNNVKISTDIVLVSNACYTFNSQNHNADDENEETLKDLQSKGALLV